MSVLECCCQPGQPKTPNCVDGVGTPCVTVTFAGIRKRTSIIGSGTSTGYELETLAGVNRSFRFVYPGSSADDQAGLVVLRCVEGCSGGVPDTLTARGLSPIVFLSCHQGEYTVIRVELAFGESPAYPDDEIAPLAFKWDADPLSHGAAPGVALPNQNIDDIAEGGVAGVDGTATVELTFDCPPLPERHAIAARCDAPEHTILVDLATNDDAQAGVRYEDQDYRLTLETEQGTPDDAAWTDEVCPDDPPPSGLKLATKCGSGTYGPEELAYDPVPAIGAGNGRVVLVINEPGIDCVWAVYYRPTTQDAPDGLLVGQHIDGTPCIVSSSRVCDPDSTAKPVNINTLCGAGGICDTLGPDAPAWLVNLCDSACGPAEGGDEELVIEASAQQAPRRAWSRREMLAAWAEAVRSGRGASPETVARRRLSCFGDPEAGVPACRMLRGEPGRRYCGACGCGKLPQARLDPSLKTGRSKLEFVQLRCPLGRPGFSNAAE